MRQKHLLLLSLLAAVFIFTACQNGTDPEQAGQPGGPVPHLYPEHAQPVGFPGMDVLMVRPKPDGSVLAAGQGEVRSGKEPSRSIATFPGSKPTSIDIAPDGSWIFTVSDNTGDIFSYNSQDQYAGRFIMTRQGSPDRLRPFFAFFSGDSIVGVYPNGLGKLDRTFGNIGTRKFQVWQKAGYPVAATRGPGSELWVSFTETSYDIAGFDGEFYIDRFDLRTNTRIDRVRHDFNRDMTDPNFDAEPDL